MLRKMPDKKRLIKILIIIAVWIIWLFGAYYLGANLHVDKWLLSIIITIISTILIILTGILGFANLLYIEIEFLYS